MTMAMTMDDGKDDGDEVVGMDEVGQQPTKDDGEDPGRQERMT